MKNLNEIKKSLYREKPIAVKNYNLSTEDTYIYETNSLEFAVPVSDMGDAKFNDNEPAQLLIRWIQL